MSKLSKQKGASFERLVVKDIYKAVSKKFDNEICFRTPRSGGHPIIGGADIIIKPKLKKIFPFDIECKHRKTIRIEKFFSPTAELNSYLKQALENTYESDDQPLLVIRGNRTSVFATSKISSFKNFGYDKIIENDIPGLVFKYHGHSWKMVLFKYVLKELKEKIRLL